MAFEAIPFLGLALLYLAFGRILARRVGAPWRGAEGYAWSVALGTGVASLWLLALASIDAIGLWTLLLPVLGLWLLGFVRASDAVPAGRVARREFDLWALPPLAVGLFLVVSSLFLETGEDALAYHVPAAIRLGRGGAGAFVGMLDAEYRLGFDLLLAPAFAHFVPRFPSGTAVLHAMASTALGAAVFAEVRVRVGSVAAGIATTLLLASSAVADYAILGFVDHAVALYGFLALSAASKALRGDRGPYPLLAGALAGFAANAKLTGAAWLVAVAVAFLAGAGLRRGSRSALLATAAGAIVALPFVVRSWLVMGNPFFPAFADSLGSGWADPRAVEHASRVVLAQTGIPRGPLLGIEGTVRAVFDPARGFEAAPWILAFLLGAALLRGWTPARRGLVAGALVAWAAWAWFVPVVRFGMGAWAWAAVASAVGAARLAAGSRIVTIGLLVAAVGLLAIDGRVVLRRSARRVGEVMANARPVEMARASDAWPGIEATLVDRARLPCGVSTDALAWIGRFPHVVALAPVRNGAIVPEDFADPARLLAACRRLGLRSLTLAPEGTRGHLDALRRAAKAWVAAGVAAMTSDPSEGGWALVELRDP